MRKRRIALRRRRRPRFFFLSLELVEFVDMPISLRCFIPFSHVLVSNHYTHDVQNTSTKQQNSLFLLGCCCACVSPSLFLELTCGAASVLLTLLATFKRGEVSIVAVEMETGEEVNWLKITALRYL